MLDHTIAFEEAHVLSAAYVDFDVQQLDPSRHLRRLWTQPLKFRNTSPTDRDLAMWHVPAEKRYGLRRLYKDWLENPESATTGEDQATYLRHLQHRLGVPRNNATKWVADVTSAAARRAGLSNAS